MGEHFGGMIPEHYIAAFLCIVRIFRRNVLWNRGLPNCVKRRREIYNLTGSRVALRTKIIASVVAGRVGNVHVNIQTDRALNYSRWTHYAFAKQLGYRKSYLRWSPAHNLSRFYSCRFSYIQTVTVLQNHKFRLEPRRFLIIGSCRLISIEVTL